jgi:hypothetical protein
MSFRDARSMLVQAYNGRIDHLHGRIVSRRQAIHDPSTFALGLVKRDDGV